MDIDYQPEHLDYKRTVDRFVAEQVRPAQVKYDFDSPMSRDQVHQAWDDLRRRGPLDEVPRDEHGRIDYQAVGILLESLAYGNASLAFMCITSLVFPAMLFESLTGEQRSVYGHLFESGQIISVAVSEPGAGSNPGEMRTVARKVDDGWVISGTKLWSSAADHSDALLLGCLVDEGDGTRRTMGQLLLDRVRSPYATRAIDTIGLRAHRLCEVVFDDVYAPGNARISADAADKNALQLTFQKGRLEMAAIAVGMAQRALDLSIAYAKERTQFGRPIAGFQLVQELLAQMYTDVSLGRLVTAQGFRMVQRGLPAAKETSMAKAFTTEMCVRVANMGVQVHGAMGLSKETEIETIARDARMMTIPDGTTQIHTLIIGRDLTGVSAMA
jgi:alkylation response protein AidB-like acyl-CoA dehydrogenase